MLKDISAAWKNYLLTQRWEDRNTHIKLTGSIHLVTRATNRVSVGSDTEYLKEAEEPLRNVLDSSFQIVPGTWDTFTPTFVAR